MKTNTLYFFSILLLGVLNALYFAQEVSSEIPDIVSLYPDRWYRMERQNQMVGYSRVRLSWVEYEGQKLIRDQTEFIQLNRRKIAHMDDVFSSSTLVDILRSPTGELIRERTLGQEGSGQDTRYFKGSMEKGASGYTYKAEILNYQQKPLGEAKIHTHTPKEVVSLDGESVLIPYIQNKQLNASSKIEFFLMDGETGSLYKHEATLCEPEKIMVAGVEKECIGVQLLNTGTQSKQYYYFQEDGLLTRIYNGDTTLFYCTEEEIKQQVNNFKKGKVSPNRLPTLETAIHTSPDLPGAFNLKSLTIELSVKKRPRVDPPDFPNNHWQEVLSREEVPERNIIRYVLKLKDFDKPVTTSYPIEAKPEFAEHLKATPLMQVDHPLVKNTAMEIVQGETDARKAAEKIAKYVYQNLSKGNSGVIGQYSAVEILQNRYGDCSEHCLLFTALCRAAGIPARRVSGLVCLGNLWGPHAWNEIWVGDWIGADPTTGDVGNVARYIFVGYPDDPYSTLEAVSKGFYGYATMRLLAACFGDGEEVDLTGKEPLYGVTETHAFNYLSGISIQKKRPDWKLTALPNRLILRGDRISLDISVTPDQGNRYIEEGYFWMSGVVGYSEIQGVRCKIGEDHSNPKLARKTIWAPAHRRTMTIRAQLNGTPEEQDLEWQEFLNAFNLFSWKKTVITTPPKETPEEIKTEEPKIPETPKKEE